MSNQIRRAETLTGTQKKVEFFSDFVTSFAPTPVGNQLGRVINEKAVNQALKNLLLTDLGERLFQPNVGSDISYFLFEPNVQENIDQIETFIRSAVSNFEPRVEIQKVFFSSDVGGVQNDLGISGYIAGRPPGEYELNITIIYNLINNPEPITFNLVLKRVR